MRSSLTKAERWLLRAEEYRAIAAVVHDPISRKMVERLGETYEQRAKSEKVLARPLTKQICRSHAAECVHFTHRLSSDRQKHAVLGIAERWLEMGKALDGEIEFVVTLEHKPTRQQIQVTTDYYGKVLSCPEGYNAKRLQRIVRGWNDPRDEYQYICRERKRAPGTADSE
jgi:hypothetical protein